MWLGDETPELRQCDVSFLILAEDIGTRADGRNDEHGEQLKRQHWVIDHADATLPALELRLATLRAEAQAAALLRHKAAIAGFAPKLIKAVEAAAEIQVEAIKLRGAAIAELGEQAVARDIPHLAFNGILLPDLVGLWRREVERMFAPPAATRRPPAAHPVKAMAKPVAARPAGRRRSRSTGR